MANLRNQLARMRREAREAEKQNSLMTEIARQKKKLHNSGIWERTFKDLNTVQEQAKNQVHDWRAN